jgi:Ca2+:H+ antiporter
MTASPEGVAEVAAAPRAATKDLWAVVVPLVAVAVLAAAFTQAGGWVVPVATLALIGAVISAVHHAEVVAHRVGEPFGTLVLALAVTAIEVSLIVSVMVAGGEGKATLARDTVYATVMIIATGVVGMCVLVGALHHHEQSFRIEGVGPALAALTTLAILVLVMPAFTRSSSAGTYTTAQLAFVGVCSLVLWCVWVFFQTVRHRDYFLPATAPGNEAVHALPPSAAQARASFGLLLVSLVGVVGLAKVLSPAIEAAVREAGAPVAVIGIAIALLVLMPETLAAVRAALADRLQTSFNLALGSALATIGLTIPVVVAVCIAFDIPIVLGLEPRDMVLLALAVLVAIMGVGTGRTNMMQGAVQVVIFAAFLFLSFVP